MDYDRYMRTSFAAPNEVDSAERRWWPAVTVLLLALVTAAVLTSAAYTTHDIHSVLIGHAQAHVTRTITARSDALWAIAISIAAIGTGVAVGLVTPSGTGRSAARIRYALGAALLVVAAGWGTSLLRSGSDAETPTRGVLSRTTFGSTTYFAEAMEVSGLGCARMRPAPIDEPHARAITCSVPWNADIRDGHDDVFVAVWSSGEPGEWLLDNVSAKTPAIAGRDWIATCEFRSTCALIGDRLHEVDR